MYCSWFELHGHELSKGFDDVQTIDKAAKTGVLKANTANRRKARLSRAKKRMLIANGLYTPVDAAEAAELAAPESDDE